MFLTDKEVAAWIDAPRVRDQVEWLDANGYKGLYTISRRGKVKILRALVEARMGGVGLSVPSSEPNWEALHGTP